MYRSRKRLRLAQHDYASAGSYHVTILTRKRERWLSTIETGEVCLTKSGEIVAHIIATAHEHYPELLIDEYVIMPDHVHILLHINPPKDGQARKLAYIVGGMKAAATRQINKTGLCVSGWHKSYYDRILRGERAIEQVRMYIWNNPRVWSQRKGPKDEQDYWDFA